MFCFRNMIRWSSVTVIFMIYEVAVTMSADNWQTCTLWYRKRCLVLKFYRNAKKNIAQTDMQKGRGFCDWDAYIIIMVCSCFFMWLLLLFFVLPVYHRCRSKYNRIFKPFSTPLSNKNVQGNSERQIAKMDIWILYIMWTYHVSGKYFRKTAEMNYNCK